MKTDVAGIQASLFGPDSTSHALICEQDGVPVGYAVYFFSYSTWLGKHGIYLEDLLRQPRPPQNRRWHRHCSAPRTAGREQRLWPSGVGRTGLEHPAIEFYESFGAKPPR